MTRGSFKMALKETRRYMSPAKRRASYNTKITWKYPFKQERQVYVILNKVFRWFSKRVEIAVDRLKYVYPVETVRRDSFQSEIDDVVNVLSRDFLNTDLTLTFSLLPLFNRIMEAIRQFDEAELEAYFLKRFGKPAPYTTDWWPAIKNNWIAELNKRAGGTAQAYLDKVQSIVLEYTKNDLPYDELVSRILSVSDSFTTNYANFLAKDLTGTLNSVINKELQVGIGINNYYWQSAADERVRGRPGGKYPNALPSHWEIDGKVCNWQDTSKYSPDYGKTWLPKTSTMPYVHPGMAWQCRCVGVPFDIDIIKEVDKELSRE